MITRNLLAVLAFSALISIPVRAQEPLVTYKSMSPELALDLARAALVDCQRRGYQVAVAVVDRFGVTSGDAAGPFCRSAHTSDSVRQGLDRGEFSHQHD